MLYWKIKNQYREIRTRKTPYLDIFDAFPFPLSMRTSFDYESVTCN